MVTTQRLLADTTWNYGQAKNKSTRHGTNKFPWSLNKKKYEYKKGDCPIAENMNDKWYIGLNMWKYDYNNSDINYIVNSFKKVWSSLKFK